MTQSVASLIENRAGLCRRRNRSGDPATVIGERPSIGGSELLVAGDRYDLDEDERVLLVESGNAAATAANALEDVLGNRIEEGVVVTDNPIEIPCVAMRPGDHPIPSACAVKGPQGARYHRGG